MKKMTEKLKHCSGFTLAETLMAVLIMLLVASVVAAGIPAAAQAYRNAVDGANAQVLISSTVNALRSELSTAWSVTVEVEEVEEDKIVYVFYYYSSRTGAKTKLYNDGDTIKVQDYVQYDDNSKAQEDPNTKKAVPPRDLVPEAMRKKTKNADLKYSLSFDNPSLSSDSDIVSFEKITVMDGEEKTIAELPLSIRLLDADMKIPVLPLRDAGR